MGEHVTQVNTHICRRHLSSQDNDLFSWTVYTLTLKTKTAGLKMGPCHSLLGVNLLCPQSCFPLSHLSPFQRVLIAHWVSSSNRLIVFTRIQLLPSATRQSDQQITSDLFAKGASDCTLTIHLLLSVRICTTTFLMYCSFSFSSSFFASCYFT